MIVACITGVPASDPSARAIAACDLPERATVTADDGSRLTVT